MKNRLPIVLITCLLLTFSVILISCGQQDGPIILENIRAGDSGEVLSEKIDNNPSLGCSPVLGLCIYDIGSASYTTFFVVSNDRLVGATLLDKGIWGEGDELLTKTKAKINTLVDHFTPVYGEPDGVSEGDLNIDSKIKSVESGETKEVTVVTWDEEGRNVELIFERRNTNMYGVRLAIVVGP